VRCTVALGLPRLPKDRHESHVVHVCIRQNEELLPMPAPTDERADAVEVPSVNDDVVAAVTANGILAVARWP